MKLLLSILAFSLIVLITSCNLRKKNITVVSFNLRYANNSDGSDSWENRKPLVKSFLKKGNFDIISFQEVLTPQLEFLTNTLKKYTVITAGREDGKNKGEHCSIFFRTSKLDLLAKSFFWLSDTPEEAGSISWGAHLPRIVTWVKLQNKRTGHIFFVFNTHLSHVSEYARNKSVLLLLSKVKSIADNIPVIVTGDFNTTSDSQPYMLMTGNWHNYFPFSDSYVISTFPVSGEGFTFNGFKNKNGIKRIDYIFVNGYLDVLKYETFNIVNKDGTYISDHFPIMAELKFNIDRKERNGDNRPLPRFAPMPVFETSQLVFEDSIIVPVRSDLLNSKIYYTLNGRVPDKRSPMYTSPVIIKETTLLTAVTDAENFLTSPPAERTFLKGKTNNARLISLSPKPDAHFSMKKCSQLFDGHLIQEQIQSSQCLNIAGKNIDFVFKLTELKEIKEVYISVLEDPKICAVPPGEIKVSISHDGYDFSNSKLITNPVPSTWNEGRSHTLYRIKISNKARFVRISLKNPGECKKESSEGEKENSRIIVDETGVL